MKPNSQPVEIKLSNQMANQLFYFFLWQNCFRANYLGSKKCVKMFVAKMFTAKKL